MSPDQAEATSPNVKRARAQSFALCEHVLESGKVCGSAAIRGTNRCRHHSDMERKNREATAKDSITPVPLSDLVAIDVTDDRALAQFRQGLLAHVGRRTLGVQEARAMHELAMAMHKDAHSKDSESAFTQLASSIAAGLMQSPPGGGGKS